MNLHRHLLALALIAFAGCDRTVPSSAAPDPGGSGDLGFSLAPALRAQVGESADSLRVELRKGGQMASRSAVLDSSVRFEGLDAGMWKISIGLYKAGGGLAYYGEDSVRIVPGQLAKADVTLKPAKGSVDIVIRIDTPQEPSALWGTWYLRQVDTFVVVGKSIELTLDKSGEASGTDGCNSISGPYKADATTFHVGAFLSTKMWCTIYTEMPSVTAALQRAATWKISEDVLVLSDSLGRPLMRYARTAPKPFPPLVDYVTIDSVGKDSAGQTLVAVQLDTAIATDSGVWLDVTLPHPGVEVRLFALNKIYPSVPCNQNPTDSMVCLIDILPYPQTVLVAGTVDPAKAYIQVLTPAKVFVPWILVDGYASFKDHHGNAFTVTPPGVLVM